MLCRIETREAESTRIGHVDPPDRRRLRRDLRPETERFEGAARAVAERRRAIVETRLRGRIGRDAFDQSRLETRRREGERETRAHQTTADDGDVDDIGSHIGTAGDLYVGVGHETQEAITASMAAGSLGTP